MASSARNFFTYGTSVKHLECYYFFQRGHCHKSAEECLYSHAPTGLAAKAPVYIAGHGMIAGGNIARLGRGGETKVQAQAQAQAQAQGQRAAAMARNWRHREEHAPLPNLFASPHAIPPPGNVIARGEVEGDADDSPAWDSGYVSPTPSPPPVVDPGCAWQWARFEAAMVWAPQPKRVSRFSALFAEMARTQ